MKFFIVASGYNTAHLSIGCVKSLLNLKYDNWEAVIISDGSTDLTWKILLDSKALLNTHKNEKKIQIKICVENLGAAYRRHQAINEANLNDEDVILFLGLDDQLFSDALDVIKKEYDKGVWMTYGNWVNQRGKGLPADFNLYFDEETHKNRDYRKVTYRSTAPNTFKYFLYKQIPETDLQVNGEWIKQTTESEVMFSCLEMSGKERIGVIKQPIYLYNKRGRGMSAKARLGKENQNRIYDTIINRPKKELYESCEPVI